MRHPGTLATSPTDRTLCVGLTNVWDLDIGGPSCILTGMATNKANFDRALGGRIRAARDRAGVKQEQLAQAVGLSRTSITNIERGRQGV